MQLDYKLKITASRYKALLAAEMELQALEYMGVDNWIGWGQAQQEYIQNYVDSHPLFLGHIGYEDYVLDGIDIDTLAEYETEMLIELEEEENAST